MSNSLRPYGLWPTRLLCPWDSLGKNTGEGCHALLQGIFPTQGSNLCLMSPVLAGVFYTTNTIRKAQLFFFYWCITNYQKLRGLESCRLIPHSFPGSGIEVPFSQSHQADIKVLAGVRISSQAWCSFPGPLVGGRTGFLLFGDLPSEFCHIPLSIFSNTIWKHINRRISLLLKVHLARSDPYRIISLQTNS